MATRLFETISLPALVQVIGGAEEPSLDAGADVCSAWSAWNDAHRRVLETSGKRLALGTRKMDSTMRENMTKLMGTAGDNIGPIEKQIVSYCSGHTTGKS
jgi:hypothetical protein